VQKRSGDSCYNCNFKNKISFPSIFDCDLIPSCVSATSGICNRHFNKNCVCEHFIASTYN
jgi:hypothetical protein